MKTQKIGILGSGAVGLELGKGFLKYGYDVMIGTRDKLKLSEWQKQTGNKGKIGSFQEAAQFADIIVYAVAGRIAEDLLKSLDSELFTGKTVIDTTNPIDAAAPVNGVLIFFTKQNESLMEILQKAVPEANFIKAFNSVGNKFMVNPDFNGQKPTMFICGNNNDAKKEVIDILNLFGWETEDMGKAESARAIESLCMLWCIPGLLNDEWSHAFKLLKK